MRVRAACAVIEVVSAEVLRARLVASVRVTLAETLTVPEAEPSLE